MFVEVMQPDVPILSSTGKGLAIHAHGEGVDGTEVTLDGGHVFLENDVVEIDLKVSGFGRRVGDVHGLLTASENDLVE